MKVATSFSQFSEQVEEETETIKNIEKQVQETHAKVMKYFDQELLKETIENHKPTVDVQAFCDNIIAHRNASFHWALTMLDFHEGRYHKQKNGWKMWGKIMAKRIKARQWHHTKTLKDKAKAEAKAKAKSKAKPRVPPRQQVHS